MGKRYVAAVGPPRLQFKPFFALRRALRRGYGLADLRSDLLAGAVVGVVALPLSMALAIASGVPPQHGLYTAIVAGGLIALLGGSKVQVSGPTAAFVVILAPIASKLGLGGLLVATMLAGVMLVLMGLFRLGRLIEYIPYPVTTGFTSGIAVVIATLQIKDLLGLHIEHMPEHFLERVVALARALPTWNYADLAIGLTTLAILLLLPRVTRRVPAPIVALPAAGALAVILAHYVSGFHVQTIQTRFGSIPAAAPSFALPWLLVGGDGRSVWDQLDFDLFRELVTSAFAIAMLGAIESLLSAVVADGMTGKSHDPDAELLAQGAGNIAAPFFGGFSATGAIARTATNIRAGARSPLAAVFHALFILLSILLFAPVLGHLPMAALAGLLLVVAWNMSEAKHFVHVLRVAPRSDVAVLLACFGLTVVFDMVVAVAVGVVLAALLFIKRMAELTGTELIHEGHPALPEQLPRGVMLYQIGGPLFFGAAQKAMSALRTVEDGVRVVILDVREVTVMDATGLVNLESTLERLHKARVFVVLGGVQDQPLELMARAGWKHRDWIIIWRNFDDALALARTLADSDLDQPDSRTDAARSKSRAGLRP